MEVSNKYKSMSKEVKKELGGHICINCQELLSTYNIMQCGHILCEECINKEESCICGEESLNKKFSLKLAIN
jgi:hypothetical protein